MMIIGSYETKRGKRFRLELSSGKVIRGLTEDEFNEIWDEIVMRQAAKEMR